MNYKNMQLTIQDHLNNTSNAHDLSHVNYQPSQGYLSYQELKSKAHVEIHFKQEQCIVKRHAESFSHIALTYHTWDKFEAGEPSIKGKTWLESYEYDQSHLSFHYQLRIDEQIIADQTFTYTNLEALS